MKVVAQATLATHNPRYRRVIIPIGIRSVHSLTAGPKGAC
jgi:hypothetical protein